MSLSTDRTEAAVSAWRSRPQPDLVRAQLEAIEAWNVSRRAIEMAGETAAAQARSREMRLDLSRRMDVLRRQHQAMVQRTEEQLRDSAHVLRTVAPARAVVVHRNDWFKDKLIHALRAGGVDVVARLENGADAVGVAIAEQPDLILVEDKLPMVNGVDVIRQALEYAPSTIATAQVSFDEDIAAVLDAGARTAFTRRVPPAEVARELCELVRA